MNRTPQRSIPPRRAASPRLLFALGLGLGLTLLALAVQGADGPSNEAMPKELVLRGAALARASAAVVGVQATAIEDAGSVATLGRERQGSGVVIGADGLVLTIGYLILEADHVDLLLDGDRTVPARVVGYDLATGFGLLQALAPIATEPAPLGSAAQLPPGEPLLVASGGEDAALGLVRMVSRRPYSGYWEYHIDGALFTSPPRPDHSGAALFNADGELLGIGSLIVPDALGKDQPPLPGNMFVPIDLLKPILAEMREHGASRGSTRAWLGVNCVEYEGQVRVVRLSAASPAEEAGLLPGDRIVAVDGVAVADLESFYKALWQRDAEREVSLDIRRGPSDQTVRLHSMDRMKTLRRPQGV
jgi:S1-C subfamily serine protease